MPGLPDHPDLDQLRRQARELLRAAVAGDPAAVSTIRAVSDRLTLSAAQLAIAREYGCRTWAALRAEVELLRAPLDRWSFGGEGAIETVSGLLIPEGLIAGADRALLSTTLIPEQDGARPRRRPRADRGADIEEEIGALHASTEIGDVGVLDDRGARYALQVRSASSPGGPFPADIRFSVEPVPARGIGWLELQGQNGTTARLLPSPRAVVRLGRLTPVTATPPTATPPAATPPTATPPAATPPAAPVIATPPTAPPDEAGLPGPDPVPDLAALSGGQWPHRDLGIALPPIDGLTLRLDSLISTVAGWSLFLRASPRWWRYRDSGRRKWSPVQITAADDQGGAYLPSFGGSAGRDGTEELTLRFTPRLDPLARRLRLTCTGPAEQITIDLDLADLPGACEEASD